MENYKSDIISTRVGCLGSSDAQMISQISHLGYVPQSAYKRLAIAKGLLEHEEHVHTKEMAFGDFIEQNIYENLKSVDERYESNPCWVSEKYSRKNIKCITHPDIVLKDDEKKTLFVYEVKASKFPTLIVRNNYAMQLYHHNLLAKEYASKLGGKWKVKVILAHYLTDGVDLNDTFTFDPSRLSLRECRFNANAFDLAYAMDIINEFLENYDAYMEDDNVDVRYLPSVIQTQFKEVAQCFQEIKEREEKVKEFKERLYGFLTKKGIKKVSCDDFAFTVVAPSEVVSIDYKRIFEEEIEAKHKSKARWLKEKHKKVSAKSGFVKITLHNNNNN